MPKSYEEWMKRREKVFVVMRGLPGSGKSTRVDEVLAEFGVSRDHVFSTDDFWTQDGGDYLLKFDADRLTEAHAWNLDRTKQALDEGLHPVVLDNTNAKKVYYQAYVEHAQACGYVVRMEEPNSPWWKAYRVYLRPANKMLEKIEQFATILFEHNTHGVPRETIVSMAIAWED